MGDEDDDLTSGCDFKIIIQGLLALIKDVDPPLGLGAESYRSTKYVPKLTGE